MGRFRVVVAATLLLCVFGIPSAFAQGEFPRVIPFSGVADGNLPLSRPISISFAIYQAPSGGPALFIETHVVTLQPNRQFQVLLGATTPGGVPASIFESNQALYVGVQVEGHAEQTPRVMFASVPYALKAADADALGGLAASQYVTEAEAAAGNAYTDAQVAAEAAARAAADSTLQGNIDAEAAARAAADFTLQTNIDAETAARSFADTTLQSNIDAEAAARAAADFTLQNNINGETAARAAADTTLQANIDAEAAVRAAADVTLQNQIDAVATSALTSLTAGTGISISGAGNTRTLANTGDTNAADDITSLSGSGGVTITGSGNSRTVGHNTWSCAPGTSIRTIDSAGVVTCETDNVGSVGSVQRSVNLPLGSFVIQNNVLDFTPSVFAPDLTFVGSGLAIEFQGDTDDAGPNQPDVFPIVATLMVPPDYLSGGTFAVRVSKDAHTGNAESLECLAAVGGVGTFGAFFTVTSAANSLYVMTPYAPVSFSPGTDVTVSCRVFGPSSFDYDNNVRIHGMEFRYTSTQ